MTTFAANFRPPTESGDIRLAVIAPTFNNVRTLRAVLDGLSEQGFASVIVVNDGSTDATGDVLSEWHDEGNHGRVVVRHTTNRGKAAAMFSGFALAREHGFTHALTIDTDGQHDPKDATRLAARCAHKPLALVLGRRPCERQYPLCSRFGRAVSNAMVQICGGAKVDDSQCGLRVYPLDLLEALGSKTSRYAFETEVLIRAAWANVLILEEPIRCIYDLPGGRISHFRLLRDSGAAVLMHARLLARSISPWPARQLCPEVPGQAATGTIFERACRWLSPFRALRQLRRDAAERERLGASIGWGLFIGTQLPLGYKGALCLLLAKIFRLQPLVTLATSSLSTPPLGFALWAGAIIVGHLILHGRWPTPDRYDLSHLGPAVVVRTVALEWLVGGLAFGACLGITAWLVTNVIVRGFSPRIRREEPVLTTLHEPL
jgi:uncharacterized protein (DUF2062 family)